MVNYLNESMQRKGLSAALTLVIAAAVLIVVALIVISMTSGGLGRFGRTVGAMTPEMSAACKSCILTKCGSNPDLGISEAADSCGTGDGQVCEDFSDTAVTCDQQYSKTCGNLLLGRCKLP